jgi:hypothetical protein
VSEKKGLKIFENKDEELKMLKGGLHSLYPSRNIFRDIKSRKMRWAGHVTPSEAGNFFLHHRVHNGSGAHSAF